MAQTPDYYSISILVENIGWHLARGFGPAGGMGLPDPELDRQLPGPWAAIAFAGSRTNPLQELMTIMGENITLPNLLKPTLKSAIVF
jgi:hypothetical protein